MCIYLTYTGVWDVGNVAHGMGAFLGGLLGCCLVLQESYRKLANATLAATLLAIFLIAIFGRGHFFHNPKNWQVYAFRGYKNLEDHDYKMAVENLEVTLNLNTHDAGSWYNLGLAYQALGNDKKAMTAFAHAHEENPSSNQFKESFALSKSHLGYRKQIQGSFVEAVDLYKESLGLNGNDPITWYNLALTYYELGDLAAAKDAAEKAASLDPENNSIKIGRDRIIESLAKSESRANPK